MSKIFLSYRRNDAPGSAGRLYDRLLEYFSDDEVFLDVDSIEPGADFIEALAHAVPNSAIVMVLIGKNWLDAVDSKGRRKIDNPADFVRAEIAAALQAGVRVIPVLIGDAQMPAEEELPPEMRQLSRLNAAHLNHRRFYADVEDLIAVIDHHLHGPADRQRNHETPPPKRRVDSGTHRRFGVEQARLAQTNARASRYINLLIAAALIGIMILLGWQIVGKDGSSKPAAVVTNTSGPSLAVLPFESLSADADASYFADGLADELLTRLSRFEDLTIASRTSTFALRGQALTVPELAELFSVSHVLAGAVRQIGERVRISVQLIDARTDRQVWADSFDRDISDAFSIQEEIALAIAGALELALTDSSRASVNVGTVNPTAYSRYLQGLGFFRKRYGDALPRAVQVLKASVAADAQFAQASALLAASLAQYNNYVTPPISNATAQGLRYAKQSLASDADNALAHAVLGYLLSDRDNWIESRRHVLESLRLDPRNDLIRLWASIHFLQLGFVERGLAEARRAWELDPELGVNNSWLAVAHSLNGYPEQAALYSERAVERGHYVAELAVVEDLYGSGQWSLADDLLRQSYARIGRDLGPLIERAAAHRNAGSDTSINWLGTAQGVEAFVLLRSTGALAPALEQAAAACCGNRQIIHVLLWHPAAAPLRRQQQFGSFAQGLGWLEYWTRFGAPDHCRLVPGGLECGPPDVP